MFSRLARSYLARLLYFFLILLLWSSKNILCNLVYWQPPWYSMVKNLTLGTAEGVVRCKGSLNVPEKGEHIFPRKTTKFSGVA